MARLLKKIASLLPLSSRIESLQRVNFAIPATDNLSASALHKLPAPGLWHVEAHEANIFRLPTARQQIVGDVFEVWLDACGVVKSLIVTEMCECFGVFFELVDC